MPTKNAHHTHEDASGQNATLPIFCRGSRNPTNFGQIFNVSNKPKHKQNAMFLTRSKNKEKVQ